MLEKLFIWEKIRAPLDNIDGVGQKGGLQLWVDKTQLINSIY